MCFVGVLFCSLMTHFGFSRSEESWCLESFFTGYLFTVSDNFSRKYKYVTNLHSKGKLYTYDFQSFRKLYQEDSSTRKKVKVLAKHISKLFKVYLH